MPTMRVHLRAADREDARRVLDHYLAGGHDPLWDDAVLEEVRRLGRTPSGAPRCVGMTNGRPVDLMFDVEVYAEISR
ncbi:hypothetical protein BJF85_13640 [Saccharomonospora sp. CUA-673]|uniref:hypothetical protein n=1 Tax=Saccharomonospora sp. CUA-673 TaxID=1904969 RepID=UPI00095F064A|nr:hypothetical protein [Saccharomonospora sp. CUA-673]OLT48276.1 hypothetical protein BJF85_13640 [Saccharomonospora sp. CUA-673]